MQRNFSLDFFRALAIMLVFTAHSVLAAGSPIMLAPLQLGGTGVDLFFVLSGWLIGNQLLLEKKRFGNIQVPRFWVRRWMRTMPAYYAVLTLTILQLYLTKDNFSFPFAHLFFLQNYSGDLSIFSVSWSLSVEEQFYLFIAPLFVITLKLPTRYQILVLLSLLACPTFFRHMDYYTTLNETHVRLDCCAMGVLLAYIKHHKNSLWNLFQSKANLLFIVSISVYLIFYVARYKPELDISGPSKLLLALIFGIWVLWSDKTNYSSHNLFTKIVMHVSTRSYAMYLLHVDALALLRKLDLDGNFFAFFALSLALTMLLSECLYRVIELPFMKSRSRFNFSKSRRANHYSSRNSTTV